MFPAENEWAVCTKDDRGQSLLFHCPSVCGSYFVCLCSSTFENVTGESSIRCLSTFLDVWEPCSRMPVISFKSFVAVSRENLPFAICQYSSKFENVTGESSIYCFPMFLDVWKCCRRVPVIISECFVAASRENPSFAVCQCSLMSENVIGEYSFTNVHRCLRVLLKSYKLFVTVPRENPSFAVCQCSSKFENVTGESKISCFPIFLDVWERYSVVSVIIFDSFVAVSRENPSFTICQCSSTFENVTGKSSIRCLPMFRDVWKCYRRVSVIRYELFVTVPRKNPSFAVCQCFSTFESVTRESLLLLLWWKSIVIRYVSMFLRIWEFLFQQLLSLLWSFLAKFMNYLLILMDVLRYLRVSVVTLEPL